MRGKANGVVMLLANTRITPAYAGKRIFFDSRFRFVQDHPRLCGEKSSFPIKQPPTSGSPPPMRGKVKDKVSGFVDGRITPAYAGKRR